MCETCGCGDTNLVSVEIGQTLLRENDRVASHNRRHFEAAGTVAINLMGSPGAGKTALLEATAERANGLRLAAMSGDLATDHDAVRLAAAGIEARSITTGTACHLDAAMVHQALHAAEFASAELLFIENVGNLVCPAIYDLGTAANVVALSVTEGEDKPLKYPVMFREANLVVLTKTDLLDHLPQVSLARIEAALARVMPEPHLLPVSAVSGDGLDAWWAWLDRRRHLHVGAPKQNDRRGAV